MSPETNNSPIINRGRGPEISGTRITVYDILDYQQQGWTPLQVAALFRISSKKIQAAFEYIELHRESVLAEYQQILARQENYAYQPADLARIEKVRQAAAIRLEEIRAKIRNTYNDAKDHGGS
ncbi:MAG: DUF433 domain-containing protein [Pirellulales bacterium]|nr:DUF433 domain-containing protein [Pirellulales bacterium]